MEHLVLPQSVRWYLGNVCLRKGQQGSTDKEMARNEGEIIVIVTRQECEWSRIDCSLFLAVNDRQKLNGFHLLFFWHDIL